CWQHNPNQRPTIQSIFEDLKNIDYEDVINNEEIFTEYDKDKLTAAKMKN
ncbi:29539_t:CDS:1, partial [Racocetra persica]